MNIYSMEPYREVCLDIVMDNGLYAGKIEADFSPVMKTRLRIKQIKLKPEYMNETVIRQALAELISSGQELGAETINWRYPEPEGSDYTDEANDPYYALMSSAAVFYSEYDLVRTVHGREYKINMDILPKRMQHDYHVSAEWIADTGITFIPFEEMSPYVSEISSIIAEDPDAALLSPLGAREYDSDTSFIALCKGEVMGWVVCKKVDNKTVEFVAFYTAGKFRAYRRGGGVIITIAIRRIQKKYSVVKLFLDDKARSLKRFYPHYFGRAFSEGTRWFYLDLIPKGEAALL
ncbi:MAG: hypothetical protein IJR27_02740 [Synergistaceae bacterium]|nr:hypothetical protein [Synergistaceae bacterium]